MTPAGEELPTRVLNVLRRDDAEHGAIRVHPILEDVDAKLFLAIVAAQGIEWHTPKATMPNLDDVNAVWDWAWTGSVFSERAFVRDAGCLAGRAGQVYRRVRSLRACLPNGTPSRWVKAILEAEIAAAANRLKQPKPKPKKE